MEQTKQTPATISSIEQFSFFNPEQFQTMQRVAKMFANSELVPDMYRVSSNNSAEKAISNCIIAIDIANRIQANILMVMQNLVIIYGRPSWSSKFLISTVNTCGRFKPLKFKFENLGDLGDVKYTDYEWDNQSRKKVAITKTFDGKGVDNIQCIAYTSIKDSDEVLESSPISLEMAIKEGWYTKAGSKWKTMPKQMLMYRSASFWTNAYAPELSMGMRTVEENQDIIDVEYEDVTNLKLEEKSKKENTKTIGIEDEKEKKEMLKQERTPQQTISPEF